MKKVLLKVIDFYQKNISSYISQVWNIHCKYEPTCSEYMKQAIEKYGAARGLWKGIRRFVRCNPFAKRRIRSIGLE